MKGSCSFGARPSCLNDDRSSISMWWDETAHSHVQNGSDNNINSSSTADRTRINVTMTSTATNTDRLHEGSPLRWTPGSRRTSPGFTSTPCRPPRQTADGARGTSSGFKSSTPKSLRLTPDRSMGSSDRVVTPFCQVSMAASATYIPGGSLSDKLRLAASKGQLDKVQELIVSGATFEPDREGRTALHYAALNGHAEIVQFLANQGCDVDSQDSLGYTALHRAAAQGHLEVIKVLLSEGCLVDRQDEHGNSALHEAAWNGYSKTLELLLKNKASFRVLNKAGFSGLHLSAQNGHNQSARVLIYAGCDRNQKNNYGDTALHTAARYGHAGVTRILISARSNLSEQNKNGDTALHISAALKRRKIAKLLTECGINTTLRNKQNETAVDVAKRKDHPEIVLIVTAAPKDSKKSKKKEKESKKKEKIVVSLPENGEKKEKKGGLFKRRSKSKDKLKDDKPKEQPGIEVPMSRAGSAPSEASSEFTSFMPPQELMKGFKHHQHRQQATHPHYQPSQSQYSQQAVRGTTTLSQKSSSSKTHPVKGLLSQYVPKNGVQYYRDLAGNIKQGPIGYAPVCACAPALKKLEKKIDADRDNMYDHIDATQRTLNDRIEGLDKRAAQQVYAIDKLTRERLDAERKDCERRQRAHASQEREYLEDYLHRQQRVHRAETQVFVDSRLTAFERQYSSNHLGAPSSNCDCCPGYEVPKYRDDAAFYSRGRISNAPLPGQLYRCKSDETLSVSSSHPSRRHWKFKPKTLRELKHMNLPKVSDKPKRSRKNRDGGRTTAKQEMAPVGRSPEGNSEGYEYEEPYTGSIYHTWSSRRQPMDEPKERKFQQAEGNSKGALIVRDNSNSRMSPSKSVPNLDGGEQGLSLPQPQVTQAGGAIYNSARQIAGDTPFSSPDQLTVHHSKTDSGSNPDSGYGSRIYGIRPFAGKPPSTSTPANNNNNPVLPDRHDSSIGTNASSITDPSSPAVTFNSGASTDTYHSTKSTFQVQAQVHNAVHNKVVQAQVHNPVHSTMPSYVERWYEKKPKQQNSGAVYAGGITPYPEQFGVKPTKPTVEIGRATQV